ncbi:hypothetical protein [Helicobacter burdigaliensis]|uniref:hypothetical protein n=1 Tax=Helicobacter burdigaliensis TaxID=2315334 RepID=UPI000EF70434|nr:hypothetical protein [Helicobacter burdigaliensis]
MRRNIFLMCMVAFFFVACGPSSKQMLEMTTSTAEERQLQIRSYDTDKFDEILSASVATMQDLGFNVDEINREFGVITSSKSRDARETGQQIGAVIAALFGSNLYSIVDYTQDIRATIVVNQSETNKKVYVRLTLQRVVWNMQGYTTKVETIKDPEIYQEFYNKLSKAVFLEANKI